jgi:hypothetical protein
MQRIRSLLLLTLVAVPLVSFNAAQAFIGGPPQYLFTVNVTCEKVCATSEENSILIHYYASDGSSYSGNFKTGNFSRTFSVDAIIPGTYDLILVVGPFALTDGIQHAFFAPSSSSLTLSFVFNGTLVKG